MIVLFIPFLFIQKTKEKRMSERYIVRKAACSIYHVVKREILMVISERFKPRPKVE